MNDNNCKMVRLKAYTEIHKNSASQEWGSSGEALWSSGVWAEPVKFNILCGSSSDKHWCKCLCGLGPGWATAWGVKMNKTRSHSTLHYFQNIFIFFFLSASVCGTHGIHPCVNAYMCCTCVCVQAYACTPVHMKWMPAVDIRCLLPPSSILCIKARSLAEPEACHFG